MRIKRFLLVLFAICFLTVYGIKNVFAENYMAILTPDMFETEGNDGGFSIQGNKSSSFSYGSNSVGKMVLIGSYEQLTQINGFNAYLVEDTVSFNYIYLGKNHINGDKNDWNITSSGEKVIKGFGYSLDSKVGNGTVLVQKSSDGKSWVLATEQINDYFSNEKKRSNDLYTISMDEIKQGTYFRIVVAYSMKKCVGQEDNLWHTDIYDYINCVEVYSFYVGHYDNPILLTNIANNQEIKGDTCVSDGFKIDKNGSSNKISVSKDGKLINSDVASGTSFYEAGTYKITSSSQTGTTFQTKIEVSRGLVMETVASTIYQNKSKNGYVEENEVYALPFSKSYTTLKIAQPSGNSMSFLSKGKMVSFLSRSGIDMYGIRGSSASIFLELTGRESLISNGWTISSDDYGKKEKEKIAGVNTGAIGTGALIVQKSKDGNNWEYVFNDTKINGLYTTDFDTYYSNQGSILIYTPDGEDIINGVYLRVYYAFKIEKGKEEYSILEKYEFYLSTDEINAVTFHNLTTNSKINELLDGESEDVISMYKTAETLENNSYTVSGFTIDTSLMPNVSYKVYKDGTAINDNYAVFTGTDLEIANSIRKQLIEKEYTETGKYLIELKSEFGTTKSVTIYVDGLTNEESIDQYFGEGFISGKRIYDEGSIPVYECGKTSYAINLVSPYRAPLSGQIKNETTGEIINILSSRERKEAVLTSPGVYTVTLKTSLNGDDTVKSGDRKVFTFKFKMITEGTAPGPVVNQKSLEDFSHSSMIDSNPIYYGVAYQSASTGYITLAFATREEARSFAYNYEKGMVEKQADGSYRYNGSFKVEQKEKYVSGWDLADAMNYFADEAVFEGYFDMSDEFYYLTLSDKVIKDTKNLRTLELNRSIVIFADKQKGKLTDIESLPIINDKKYAYLTPGKLGKVDYGVVPFEFVKDKYECDSSKVIIIDKNGKKYNIAYNESVEQQLMKQDCPSGIIDIYEDTIYGDSVTYQAVYIRNGENTSELTITYYINGEMNEMSINQNSEKAHIEAEAFSISSFVDELDSYNLIKVSNGKTESCSASNSVSKRVWSDEGEYTVSVVNRLGFGYSFDITVNNTNYVTISFTGEGTEEIADILTQTGATEVILPVLERYGYEFKGFIDESGIEYKNMIDVVDFDSSVILSPVWEAKEIDVIIKDQSGNVINNTNAKFGDDFVLPESINGIDIQNWILNGEPITSETIEISNENSIELVAILAENGETEALEENNSKSSIGYVFVGIIAVIIAAGLAFVLKKEGNKHE